MKEFHFEDTIMVEIGQIVNGLIPNEAAKITKIRNLGDKYSVAYIGVNSNKSSSKVLTQSQIDALSLPQREPSILKEILNDSSYMLKRSA